MTVTWFVPISISVTSAQGALFMLNRNENFLMEMLLCTSPIAMVGSIVCCYVLCTLV